MAVGPDLISVKSKGREALLTAILEPHKEVAPQYIAYDVATKDGNAYTGIVARDDATGLSLKIMGGAEVTLARATIRGSSSAGQSLMPEGLEAGLSVSDMADLLGGYAEQLRATEQIDEADRVLALAGDAGDNFLMIVPEKVQADPSISTE
jgi:putative heme-binding domain-containing protein